MQIQIKNIEKWRKYQKELTKEIIIFATIWAKIMEDYIQKGYKLENKIIYKSLKETRRHVGFFNQAIFGLSLNLLIENWYHGKKLESWYQKQLSK